MGQNYYYENSSQSIRNKNAQKLTKLFKTFKNSFLKLDVLKCIIANDTVHAKSKLATYLFLFKIFAHK